MNMNMAQVQSLSADLFRTADTDDEIKREQALWQLESAFGVLLGELKRPPHDSTDELNRQRVIKLLLSELDH